MSRKGKGSNAERELIHLFHSVGGWGAVRVAGSGSNKYPSPDVLAGNGSRCVAIECKSTRDDKKYLEKREVEELKVFAKRFGAEAWVAVRFMGCPWYFLRADELEDTGNCFAVSREMAQKMGIVFNQLVVLRRKL